MATEMAAATSPVNCRLSTFGETLTGFLFPISFHGRYICKAWLVAANLKNRGQ